MPSHDDSCGSVCQASLTIRFLRWQAGLRQPTTSQLVCGRDEQSQQRYRDDLGAAGCDVLTAAVEYVAGIDVDELIGSLHFGDGQRPVRC